MIIRPVTRNIRLLVWATGLALAGITFSGQVFAATATASPTSCVNDASIGVATGNWIGLTNVDTQNNVYAQASVRNSDVTNYLKCTGYGFSIPAGATINGITVEPWLNASYTMYDNAMQLVKGGAIQATNLATGATIPNGRGAFAPSPTQFTYGSSTYLWGNTWTAADINSANFGAAFAAQRGGFNTTQQVGVDAMPITIDYTATAGGGGSGSCSTSAVGSDTVVTCTGNGNITIPSGVTSVRYLVVGGGGGGGGNTGGWGSGAGGAGGVLNGTGFAVTGGATYTVTVGAGGSGGTGGVSLGGNGSNSTFSTLTAIGGGGGASQGINNDGANGGSGGSGRGNGSGGTGTTGQGNNGGDGSTNGSSAGGGGGAGGAGISAINRNGGSGGAGVSDNITGAAITYGAGGTGGGRDSGYSGGNGAAGTPNTGNGGDGTPGRGGTTTGGAGGSGIVVIRYTPATVNVLSINLASANPTNPATSVSWTVTFNTSVTGVDATDFALVQTGSVSGASISSVTGSGATWTVTADTGSGYGTLGLNLLDDDSIVDGGGKKLGGTGVGNGNFTGQVYTIEAPLSCITDDFSTGTLDTSLWNVQTIQGPYLPQVVNAGGGDYRLRLTDTNNNEATFAQLNRTFPAAGNKVVLEIDYFSYGGSGADGTAVTFSDASVSSTTGGFGGSLGYAQNNTNLGFGGGWLGIGLDEYGNFPCNNESRTGYPAGWVDPVLGAGATVCGGSGGGNHYVVVRGSGSGTTGYNLLANTGLIAATAPAGGAGGATPYRYRITLDHSDGIHAYVTVERDTTGTGASYNTLIPKFDAKGPNSGQTAVPTNWLVSFTGSTGGATNNHEFKQVKVCANTIVGSGPDHLEIQHPNGTGLTCTPSTLTIKACANAACTTAYTGGVTGTLSAAGTPTVNWSGGNGFSIPAGSSTVTKNVQVTTPGSVVFDAASTPAATSATSCNFGSPGCTFTASDTGLLLSAPSHVAETTAALTVQAVKKADNSLVCVPAFANTAKTVNLKCAYSNPATGTLPVRVGGTALNAATNTAAACDATGANVSLNFDATGTATPSLQYADVGQMNLTASYTGTAGSLDAGLSMTGAASFIAAPASFAFSNLPAGSIKSGNPFSVTVSALNNAGAVTPNFGKETSAEGVTLTSSLVTPDPVAYPSAVNPVPGNSLVAGTEFGAGGMVADANGEATVNNLSWGEVGSITLKGTLTSGNYLGSGLSATGTSATIGAFIPDHLDTAVVPTTTLPMPCPTGLTCPALYNGFVYSGQPFRMQVIARNLAGGTTTNYSSVYGLANSVAISVWDALGSLVAPTGAGALANGTLASSAFASGVGSTYTQAYTFNSSTTAPTDIFLRAVDTANTTVTSRRAVPATSVEGGVKVVSGRVTIPNAYGSELLPLPLAATIQYWDNSDWVTSTTDDVTQFDTNLSTSGGNIVVNILNGLGGGLSVASPGVVTVTGGVNSFTLNAPSIPGSADISLNAPDYLLAGSNGAGVNPSDPARVTFGIFKGSDKMIYMREVY